VLQAGVLSSGGEVFMLDMGEPVNILELAERMVRLSGHVVGTEIAVTFVGTRPGEKLSEDLWGAGEACLPTSHPSIVAIDGTRVPAGDLADVVAELGELVAAGADDAAEALLREVTSPASLDEPRSPLEPLGAPAASRADVVAAGARLS
jgi:FlaA1/EpsC-like NDP-sugar epimerase